MSTLIHPTTAAPTPVTATELAGLRVRRAALVAMPVVAGLALVVGAVADPAAGKTGDELLGIYGDHMARLQVKSLAFATAYALWIGTAFLLARQVRGRGVWLANVAGFLAFAGMVTLPGMLMIDWIDSAAVQLWGVEGASTLHDRVEGDAWGLVVFMAAGRAGLLLALPLAAAAAWRAGLFRWWGFAATLGALAAFIVGFAMWPGCLVATAFFGVVAYAVARAPRTAR